MPFDGYVDRPLMRITTIYAAPWHVDDQQLAKHARSAGEFLRLSRLAHFYDVSQRQLPRVVSRASLAPSTIEYERWSGTTHEARAWCFALPSGQLLPAVTLDVEASMIEIIPLLEDLYYASITIDGEPFARWSAASASQTFAVALEPELLPERHQIVFAAITDPDAVPDEDAVQRVVYRADLPVRPGSTSIAYPPELNRRPTMCGALGPYVSVIAGNQDYVENAILLSAVQSVASLAALRGIRHRTYRCLELLRDQSADGASNELRLTLEQVADTVADLEVALSFEAEATTDLGMIVPSLRVESYHRALCEAMRIEHGCATIGRMLERLRNAIGSELDKVQSIEQRADEARRLRTAVAVTFVTTIGGTLSLLFGYFGMNAAQVDGQRSIFDHKYVGIYLTIALIIIAAGTVFSLMTWVDRRRAIRDRNRARRWLPAQHAPDPVSTATIPAARSAATDLV